MVLTYASNPRCHPWRTSAAKGAAVLSSAAETLRHDERGVDLWTPATGGALAGMQADRDRLTHLLRGLAAELDELDRQLSDITWQRGRPVGAAETHVVETHVVETDVVEIPRGRTALEAEREHLTTRLHVMARLLNQLDAALSDLRGQEELLVGRVGPCPQCGYPSLGSGLCAYCRPHLLAH